LPGFVFRYRAKSTTSSRLSEGRSLSMSNISCSLTVRRAMRISLYNSWSCANITPMKVRSQGHEKERGRGEIFFEHSGRCANTRLVLYCAAQTWQLDKGQGSTLVLKSPTIRGRASVASPRSPGAIGLAPHLKASSGPNSSEESVQAGMRGVVSRADWSAWRR